MSNPETGIQETEVNSMLCKENHGKIENVYPKDAALSWDNVGLLAGRDDKEVRKSTLRWMRQMKWWRM